MGEHATRKFIIKLLEKAIGQKYLDCQYCGKILNINDMYSVDACSEKCQDTLLEMTDFINERASR